MADLTRLTPLRAAVGPDSGLVHLVLLLERGGARESLCGTPVTAQMPSRLLTDSGCAQCAAVALRRGHTFADDRHGALVSLQRTPHSANNRFPANQDANVISHFATEVPVDPVPVIEEILDGHEAAGTDRLTGMSEVLGTEAESHDAWVERLRRWTTSSHTDQ